MSLDRGVSRRAALRAILVGTLTAAWTRGAGAALWDSPALGEGLADRAAACVSMDRLLAQLGVCYLRNADAEASIPLLLSRIGERWPDGTKALERLSFKSLRYALAAIVRRDLERTDVVLVDGWVLARSEARLYAIAHLVRDQR